MKTLRAALNSFICLAIVYGTIAFFIQFMHDVFSTTLVPTDLLRVEPMVLAFFAWLYMIPVSRGIEEGRL